jgi:hypothetical protein
MFFSSWLRKPNVMPRTSRRPTSRFRPQLEVLERRALPSTLNVTNLGDGGKGSLRFEIAAAHSGDTIVFDKKLDGGTITLWSDRELLIGKNLTIRGPGAGLLTITSDPNIINTTRIFEIDSATVTLSGLTISNGRGRASATSDDFYDGQGGGILNRYGTLTISDCTLSANTAYYGGGVANLGTLTVTNNSTLSGNVAGNKYGAVGYGGAIYNVGHEATVSGCTLSGNSAGYGGGIYNAAALTVLDSVFSGNSPENIYGAYTDGGGNTFS